MPAPAPLRVDDGTRFTQRAWRFLERELKELGTPLPEPIVPVLDFQTAADRNPTTLAERRLALDQAELLFRDLYVHLPFKTEAFRGYTPKKFLDTIRYELKKSRGRMTETVFQSWMIAAFSSVRDAHTLYGLPAPYRGAVAFLPFQMRCVTDPLGHRRYVVTRVMKGGESCGFGHRYFGPGVEIVGMVGTDIDSHVQRAADRLPGVNNSALYGRAALHCTLRPLSYTQFPFDDEIPAARVEYLDLDGNSRAIDLPWGVARFPEGAAFPSATFSVSELTRCLSSSHHHLHCREELRQAQRAGKSKDPRQVSSIREVFEFQYTGGKRKKYPIDLANLSSRKHRKARFGYIHIKRFVDGSFGDDSTSRIVDEFRRILELLDREAPDGLVLDIRGNPGGDIQAAERMLQMLTPRRIVPENFHLLATRSILRVLRNIRAADARPGRLSKEDLVRLSAAKVEFAPWLEDADRQPFPKHPDRLTSGRPLTSADHANDIGQVYQGPVALLIDGLTYSAADIFAAGFQDHNLGSIVGVDSHTGGGGGNVWNHADLLSKLGPKSGVAIVPLPRNASMTVAIRRCSRVHRKHGVPVEDYGVKADVHYQPLTYDDVVAGYPGILPFTCEMLAGAPHRRVEVEGFRLRKNGAVAVTVRATGADTLRFYLDGTLATETKIRPGRSKTIVVPATVPDAATLRIEGLCPSAAPGSKKRILCAVRTVAIRQRVASAASPPPFEIDSVTGLPTTV